MSKAWYSSTRHHADFFVDTVENCYGVIRVTPGSCDCHLMEDTSKSGASKDNPVVADYDFSVRDSLVGMKVLLDNEYGDCAW